MSDTRVTPADPRDVRTVAVGDGRRVAYADYGAPDGDPVVFLHGTPGSRLLGGLFDEDARRRGVRLLAPDRPGYGRSSPWSSRTLADTGAFLAPVLDDAGVDRAGVVGFSGGGPHALAFAATRGDRCRGVDVVAGATPPSAGTDPPTQRLLGALAARTPRLLSVLLATHRWVAERSAAAVVGQYTTAAGRADLPDAAADLVARDFVEALDRRRSGAVTESRLLAREWDVPLDDVGAVRFWHGTRDANVPVAGVRALVDRLTDARLTAFEGADHLGALRRWGRRGLGRRD